MKRNMKKLIVFVLALLMVLSQVSYAKVQTNNGKTQAYGQLKKLEGFTQLDGKKIKVNNKNLNFDVPPVIKGGRTLIPVRAITEALGCTVEWDKVNSRAYVISPDATKIFAFDLINGKIYVFTGKTLAEIKALALSAWVPFEVVSDAAPAMLNNRTFVPLRFIAEELGLKVSYDNKTGNIDIKEVPELIPASYTKAEFGILSDLPLEMKLNGYSFVGIENLTLTTHYIFLEGNKVTLKADYLNSIKVAKTELKFLFAKGNTVESKTFTINLNYLNLVPSINSGSKSFSFDKFDDPKAVTVGVTLNGFSINKVYTAAVPVTQTTPAIAEVVLSKGETVDHDYKLGADPASIIFSQKYLNSLAVGNYTLSVDFIQGSRTITETINIVVRLDQPTVAPVTNNNYTLNQEGTGIVYNVTYNGYTFDSLSIKNADVSTLLVATTEYSFNPGGTQLTVLKSYLDGKPADTYTLDFVFKKGTNTVTQSIVILVSPAAE